MTTILHLILTWAALSIPASLVIGKMIAIGDPDKGNQGFVPVCRDIARNTTRMPRRRFQ